MTGIDPKRLAEWFEAFASRLVLYARQWLEAGAAEDAVQDTFARLAAQPRPPDSPKAWLFRGVRNAAIDQARRGRRHARRLEQMARQAPPLFEADPGDLIDAATIRQALESLDAPRREVVVLRVWGSLSLKEMAQVTGRPVSTLSYQYRSALDDIRKKMGEPCRTNTKAT